MMGFHIWNWKPGCDKLYRLSLKYPTATYNRMGGPQPDYTGLAKSWLNWNFYNSGAINLTENVDWKFLMKKINFRNEHLDSGLLTPRRLNSTWISGHFDCFPENYKFCLDRTFFRTKPIIPLKNLNREPSQNKFSIKTKIVFRSWVTISNTKFWRGHPQCQNS